MDRQKRQNIQINIALIAGVLSSVWSVAYKATSGDPSSLGFLLSWILYPLVWVAIVLGVIWAKKTNASFSESLELKLLVLSLALGLAIGIMIPSSIFTEKQATVSAPATNNAQYISPNASGQTIPYDANSATTAPAENEFWGIILASLNENSNGSALLAERRVASLKRSGFDAQYDHSGNYSSLSPGYIVVFISPFSSSDEAKATLKTNSALLKGGYVKRFVQN